MQDANFTYIAGILKERSGLALAKEKEYLLQSRLQPIARSRGIESIDDLVSRMRTTNDPDLIHEVAQAMTTNETMFFRDNKPFDKLKQVVLPKLFELSPTPRKLRIWSAACSAGQEPYSIAICLEELLARHPGYSYEIIATDLCEQVVNKARQGLYSQFEVQRGLPIQMMIKYFSQAPDNQWQVNESLKKHIRFDLHNLLHDCSKFGRFDVVFCRNVLIYFDEATKRGVLDRIAGAMNPPGYLFLGSAETVMGITTRFAALDADRNVYVLT